MAGVIWSSPVCCESGHLTQACCSAVMEARGVELPARCYSNVAEQHPITLQTCWDQVRQEAHICLCGTLRTLWWLQHPGQRQAAVNSSGQGEGSVCLFVCLSVCLTGEVLVGLNRPVWMDAWRTLRNLRVWPWKTPCRGMFRKINNVFRPNHHGHRGRDGAGGPGGGLRSEQDYHSACTVRLVRSTSMLVVGERSQAAAAGSTLKRSKSTVSIESTLYYYQRQEDRIWLYSQNQNCLEYLEALVALRRQYTKSVSDLKSSEAKATVSSKKKPAPPPPPRRDEPVRPQRLSESTEHRAGAITDRCSPSSLFVTADIKSQTLRASGPRRGGHSAVLWRGHRQLWQRASAQTLPGRWTRRCGLHRCVWKKKKKTSPVPKVQVLIQSMSTSPCVLFSVQVPAGLRMCPVVESRSSQSFFWHVIGFCPRVQFHHIKCMNSWPKQSRVVVICVSPLEVPGPHVDNHWSGDLYI